MKVFLLALLTAVLWGIAPLFEKLGLGTASPLAALSVRTLTIGIGLGAYLMAVQGWREFATLDSRSILFIVLGALAAGLLAQFVYFVALKMGDASRVVPIVATYPLIAALLSIVFLREPLTPGKIIGAVLIVLGILAIRMDQILWPR